MSNSMLWLLLVFLSTCFSTYVHCGPPDHFVDCNKHACVPNISTGGTSGQACLPSESLFIDATIIYFCGVVPFVKKLLHIDEATMVSHSWKLDLIEPIYLTLFTLLLLILLSLFFLILFLCANNHLIPTLGLISDGLSLSPSVAGVTLLALGNAAPDLFTSLAGVEDIGNVPLVISGAIGSGLFVTVFVLGIILYKTKPSIPPLKQPDIFGMNILMYLCALAMIALIVFPRHLSLFVPLIGVLLYVIYIGFVLWFETPSPSSPLKSSSAYLRSKSLQSLRMLSKAASDNRISEANKTQEESPHHHININVEGGPVIKKKKNYFKKMLNNPLKAFVYVFTLVLFISIPPLLVPAKWVHRTHMKRRHRIRLLLFPFCSIALILSVFHLWSVNFLVFYLALCTGVSLTLFALTRRIVYNSAKFRAMCIILAVLSFSMSTFWSWIVSREVVALFSSISVVVPSIPKSVLGLTVLAWGNSFGDLVVGIALSTTENFELGVTGVFSGPVLNVLLSLSVSIFKILVSHDNKGFDSTFYPVSSIKLSFDSLTHISLFLLAVTTILSYLGYRHFTSFGKRYGIILLVAYVGLFIPFSFTYPWLF